MTQFIEPNKKSDLVAPRVFDWLRSLRSGLLEGFEVTAVASTQLINIASGRVVIGGTTIHDDLTRNNSTIIQTAGVASPTAGNTHVMIYAQYTYADTFPPASMDIEAIYTQAAAPATPASPTLPADAVKLADIFIAEGETTLDNAQIINAPKMPDRGQNDGDVLIERLISSNFNVIFAGGGAIAYDGVADELSWTQDMFFYATTTTHQEKFFTAPLAAGQVDAGDSPLGSVGDNAIVFAVFDRTSVSDPSTPVALTLRVLDLDNPDATARNLFFDPATRENIVWVAMTIGGTLYLRSGFGGGLPTPDASGDKFLRNDPGGSHYWSLITEDLIQAILSISTFVCTSSPVEVGVNVLTPAFTASYAEGPVTAATLREDVGGLDNDVVLTPPATAFNGTTAFQKLDTNETVTYRLTADAGDTPDTALVNLQWQRYVYSGADNDILATTAIKTLNEGGASEKALRPGRGITITKSGLSGQYFYFAYADDHHTGDPVLQDNNAFGAEVDIVYVGLESSLPTDNGSGNATDYRLYRTLFQLTGDVDFTVV